MTEYLYHCNAQTPRYLCEVLYLLMLKGEMHVVESNFDPLVFRRI